MYVWTACQQPVLIYFALNYYECMFNMVSMSMPMPTPTTIAHLLHFAYAITTLMPRTAYTFLSVRWSDTDHLPVSYFQYTISRSLLTPRAATLLFKLPIWFVIWSYSYLRLQTNDSSLISPRHLPVPLISMMILYDTSTISSSAISSLATTSSYFFSRFG